MSYFKCLYNELKPMTTYNYKNTRPTFRYHTFDHRGRIIPGGDEIEITELVLLEETVSEDDFGKIMNELTKWIADGNSIAFTTLADKLADWYDIHHGKMPAGLSQETWDRVISKMSSRS